MTKLDKREFKRYSTDLIVHYRLHNKLNKYSMGISSNYSHEGLCFESSRFDHTPGEKLELVLEHPHSELSMTVLGQIIWKRERWYKCLAGVKFKDMDLETNSKIMDLISSAKRISAQSSFVSVQKAERAEKENTVDTIIGKSVEKTEVKTKSVQLNETFRKVSDTEVASSGETKPQLNINHYISVQDSVKRKKEKGRLYALSAVAFVMVFAVLVIMVKDRDNATQSSFTESTTEIRHASPVHNELSGMATLKDYDRAGQVSASPEINDSLPKREDMRNVQHSDDVFTDNKDADAVPPFEDADDTQPESIPSMKADAQPVTVRGEITFDQNSDIVSPLRYPEIDKVAEVLLSNPETTVKVEGHADSNGPELYNLDLAMRRAMAVKGILNQKGIDNKQIKIVVYGDSNPVASNDTDAGRMRNRRVELNVDSATAQ